LHVTIDEAFDLAIRKHEAGDFSGAAALYRQVLAAQPKHADAMHLLGVVAYQSRDLSAASDLIAQALAIKPQCPEYLGNMGLVLMAAGRLDEAIAAYRRAIELKPGFGEALSNLAEALLAKGDLDSAAVAAREALKTRRDMATAVAVLGNALLRKKDLNGAVDAFRQAAALNPNDSRTQYNLGVAMQARGDYTGAIESYQRAIALRPDYVQGYNNLGGAFQATGRNDEAIAAFEKAILIRPEYLPAQNNLCVTLTAANRFDEAASAARRALAMKPDWVDGLLRLGYALRCTGKLREGAAAYQRAVELEPQNPVADSSRVYAMHFDPRVDAKAILCEHLLWDQRHAAPLRKDWWPHENNRDANRRIRIGYVSPDFRHHCQALFMLPVLKNHDREAVEVYCYSSVGVADEMTARSQGHSDAWRSVTGVSDAALAEMIRADEIDLLVDLTMHMGGGRPLLFARKPAPVQATWLAYPGTTGLSAMDYRLTDPHLDPKGMYDDCYAEKSLRLADTFWCYDPVAVETSDKSFRVSAGLVEKNGLITFGCLNNFFKINETVLELWARVLRAVKGSRILILSPEGSARQWSSEALTEHGVEADRIEFVPRQPHTGYLELFNRIDISLDTFPYNGHTTSLDSMWMGVPVVTRVGQTVVGRAGLSQCRNLGLPELVADSDDDFVRIATELAGDSAQLAALRKTLRDRMAASPLLDAPRFCRNLESAYRRMWRDWCGL
jgi:predicted O-linked N-acetylglucosamine transferase (SPINDLY family)